MNPLVNQSKVFEDAIERAMELELELPLPEEEDAPDEETISDR